MALSDEWQLQIYIIIGVVSFFLLALILAVSLLTYYVVKLYKERRDESSYLRYNLLYSAVYTLTQSLTFAQKICRHVTIFFFFFTFYRRHNVESGNAYKNNVYSNSALDLDDELNRRYTMHRSIEEQPQPPSLRSFGTIESISVKGTGANNKSK